MTAVQLSNEVPASGAGKRERKLHIELMRIIAIFFVIFNHSGGFFAFPQYVSAPPKYWISLFASVFCKFAVPLFFAISGALLLMKPEESLRKLWLGRIFKFALILFLGSLYAYGEDLGMFRDPKSAIARFSLQEFIKLIYFIDLRTHYWYLYAYIAFLIVVPFLRAMVQNLQTRYFYYMMAIALVSKAVLPMAEYYVWKGQYTLNPSFNIAWIASDVVLYPCVGYFLEHRSDLHRSGKKILLLWIANIAAILTACWMTRFRADVMGSYDPYDAQYFHKSFDLVGCVAMYASIRYLCDHVRFPEFAKKLIFSCSGCCFGIYLLHLLVPFGRYADWISAITRDPLLGGFLYSAYLLLACWILTALLKKIPLIRKLL